MNRDRFLIACFFLGMLICSAKVFAAKAPSADGSMPVRDLGNPKLLKSGFVDVTAAPFSADPTGRQDSTASLQEARRTKNSTEQQHPVDQQLATRLKRQSRAKHRKRPTVGSVSGLSRKRTPSETRPGRYAACPMTPE